MAHLDDHAVTDGNTAGAIRDLADGAGRLHARREWQIRLELVFARRHQDVRKIDARRAEGDAHLAFLQGPRDKGLEPKFFRRPVSAADDRARHQAALAFRRDSASRNSGSRSLPKYMSVLSRKIVGEPKPPRAITSSVFALS